LEEYKEYLLSAVEKWFSDLEHLKEFIDTNNKKPSPSSKEPLEKFLAKWLSHRR
jgi:hypothetical protein